MVFSFGSCLVAFTLKILPRRRVKLNKFPSRSKVQPEISSAHQLAFPRELYGFGPEPPCIFSTINHKQISVWKLISYLIRFRGLYFLEQEWKTFVLQKKTARYPVFRYVILQECAVWVLWEQEGKSMCTNLRNLEAIIIFAGLHICKYAHTQWLGKKSYENLSHLYLEFPWQNGWKSKFLTWCIFINQSWNLTTALAIWEEVCKAFYKGNLFAHCSVFCWPA